MNREHELIVGSTRTGKTHSTLLRALRWEGPVLWWNPQDDPNRPDAWRLREVRADLHDDLRLMFTRRSRISYVPDLKSMQKELAAIVSFLTKPGQVWSEPVLLVIDEADMVSPQGKVHTPAIHIAARGAKHEVWAWFVTQFPAQLSKTVVRNCARNTIFPSPYAAPYYKVYGLPGDEIDAGLLDAPKYSYFTWTMPGVLAGPLTTGADGTEKLVAIAK